MKNFKRLLHIWITSVSMIAFLAGWAFLAHAPNSAASQAATTASQSFITTTPSQASSSLFSITPSTRNSANGSSTTIRTGGS